MVQHTGELAEAVPPGGPTDPPGRLLAQRTLFAAPTTEAPDEMYCSATQGAMERSRSRLTVLPHALVTTNTYFGRFPASYWQRWTSVRSVEVTARVSGAGTVRVMASDSEGRPRPVVGRRVQDDSGAPLAFSLAIDRFADGGAFWLELETEADTLVIDDVRWTVVKTRPRRPTVVVICTFNRVDDCLATLGTLATDREVASGLGAVYVVDQGTDILESRESFPLLREELGTTLHYIRQPNYGGAGGFTRGVYEAVGAQTDARVNVLLMDDDIRLEPDTVVRLRALADAADQPILVGGQMLTLLHPNRLHVGAEAADLSILRAGLPVEDALTDADVTKEQQDLRVDAAYNAWWTCLIPSEVVEAVGYPLPLFFQWDDIEYGLRAAAAGFPTVTLPGAGVWHADFGWKNWDDWSRYFSFRNSLIVSALHSDFDRRSILEYLSRELANYIVSMRYGLAALTIRAIEDFLRGPEVLSDGGAQVGAEVRRLWAQHPETTNHAATALPGVPLGVPRRTPGGDPSMPRAVFAKRVAWQLLGRNRGTAAVSSRSAAWWHVSLFETAVVTDASQAGFRVRRFDRARMVALSRQSAAVLWRFVRESEQARSEYRRRFPELTSRDNWTRLFGAQ
jgi:galactofuranosylgalactofuranosylrhamnosyl-N-acetylglucosaminyl-diphospho-decaprenol beta-1,5/1,6-galactofuranosyltransferase